MKLFITFPDFNGCIIEVCYVLVYYVRTELTISNVTKWYVIIGNKSILEESMSNYLALTMPDDGMGAMPSVGPMMTEFWFHEYHDSKGHGANMGPIWDRQDPGGPHVGPMTFAIWVYGTATWVDNNK